MIHMSLTAAADLLQTEFHGNDVEFHGCSIDSRTLSSGSLFIALRGENFDGHDFLKQAVEAGAVAAMVEHKPDNPAVPLIIVEDSKVAMGKLARQWRTKFSLPVVAVTGSNGKSTVKEMLASILSQQASVLATYGNLNNDIGVPLTLFGLHQDHEFAVIEMGANHPGEIKYLSAMTKPDVAVITLCAPSHIEGFGSIDGVANAKAEIFSGLSANGVAIINADDKYAELWQEKTSEYKRLTFGLGNNADVCARDIQMDQHSGRHEFTLTTTCVQQKITLPLAGLHNVQNALAAAACCIALNIPGEQIRNGLQSMQAVKGRMEIKPGLNRSRIIDDTYNANPASLDVAIRVATETSRRSWLVLGDMGELGDIAESAHEQAGEIARAAGIERLYAIGELSKLAVNSFGKGATHYSNKEDLIASLRAEVFEGLTLLVKGSRAMAMEKIVQSLIEEN